MKARNWVPGAILASPAHMLLSWHTLMITFTGRRTGRRYATPVAYVTEPDGDLLIATDSPWWRNLRPSADVELRLRGQRVGAHATVLPDAEQRDGLVAIVRARPSYGRWARVPVVDGDPDLGAARRAIAEGRRVIRLRLLE